MSTTLTPVEYILDTSRQNESFSTAISDFFKEAGLLDHIETINGLLIDATKLSPEEEVFGMSAEDQAERVYQTTLITSFLTRLYCIHTAGGKGVCHA